MIDKDTLMALARLSVDAPWGMGIPWLNDAESAAPYYRFLYKYVQLYKPKLAVECGVYLGRATAHMALANQATHVIGIDSELRSEALAVRDNYCDNVQLVEADSTSYEALCAIEHYAKTYGAIELLFLDSTHDGATPMREFVGYRKFLADECLVACDDIHISPDMDYFWNQLPGYKIDMSFLHAAQYPGMIDSGFGVSIWRKDGTYA